MQAQEDLLTLRSKNSELSTEVEQLRTEVSQVKRNNNQLDNESKRLREQNRTLQNKEQQVIKSKNVYQYVLLKVVLIKKHGFQIFACV